MKVKTKLVKWFRAQWWRLKYKRVNLDEGTISRGRCLECDAGNKCNYIKAPCPCKYNQHLKRK